MPRLIGFGCSDVTLLMAAVLLLFCAASAHAAGQAVGTKHPVLDHGLAPGQAAAYEAAVARVMAMSEDEMLSYVPDKPVVRFCDCPHCHGGSQGDSIFTWTIDRPDQLKCRYCGTVYPDSRYPEDQTLTGKNALGETITYRYHDDKRAGLHVFLTGNVALHKRGWVLGQCRALGRAWQVTSKPEYARRAVLILDRLAQVYPHYPVTVQPISGFEIARSQQPPYPGMGGKWGRWAWDELPAGVPEAYDLVYDSDEFDALSQRRGYDVREKIERDFLKATFDYMQTFSRHDNNMSPFYLVTAADLGRVINEPHYVHWAYTWLLEILNGGCFYDGMWHEAPSYHYQTLSGLRQAFGRLRGYSDPAGYVDKADGLHFDKLDPDRDVAFLARALDAPAVIGFPNGCSSPVHDTWPGSRQAPPRHQTVSTICPGYGHASLGRGEGLDQLQAQLHFSGAYGHSHLDNLNLTLFAKGREMLSDLGYTHTQARAFTVQTVGHNLVAIDRQNQTSRSSDGDLLSYQPDLNGVAMVEADGRRAVANITDATQYRRLLLLVPVSREDAYVVDIFRVHGGAVHDWLLHGDADRDMTASCTIPLTPGRESMLEPGEKWVEPKNEGSGFNGYGAIRDVQQGKADTGFSALLCYADQPETGVRIHLLGDVASEAFLGKSPSIRRAGKDDTKAFSFWMPQLIVRRRGIAPLQSVFAAVEEPFSGGPFLSSVEPLTLTPADPTAVALRITHGNVVDTIISTLDEPPYPPRLTADGVKLHGRLGIVRREAGKTTGLWLVAGSSLASPDASLTCQTPLHVGDIERATRKADGQPEDALFVSEGLPAGTTLHGAWMIVTHGNGFTHGYEIDRVEVREGKTVVILTQDHGLRIEGDKTREVFFPRREMTGPNRYRIDGTAAVVAGA